MTRRSAACLPAVVGAEELEPELADAELIRPEVMGELVADRAGDLRAQLVRVVAEVAQERVAEDDDALGVVVAGGPGAPR